jgi:DNA ligase-1
MKPMLAATVKDVGQLKFPLLASPKIDGVRAIVINGMVMSRSLKPIPNMHVQFIFGRSEYNGLDGELVVGPPNAKDVYNKTVSGVMAQEGKPDIHFLVFDDCSVDDSFQNRLVSARLRIGDGLSRGSICRSLPQRTVHSHEDVLELETKWLAEGYEGVMLRHPHGPYKHGRSTMREGWLMKLKRFTDGEATVVGFTQAMHNSNDAEVSELGGKVRSSKKAGMVPVEKLGSLVVKDVVSGIEFEIGTGYNDETRVKLWKHRAGLVGNLVKYKHQEVGAVVKPRFPVFIGFRSHIDL